MRYCEWMCRHYIDFSDSDCCRANDLIREAVSIVRPYVHCDEHKLLQKITSIQQYIYETFRDYASFEELIYDKLHSIKTQQRSKIKTIIKTNVKNIKLFLNYGLRFTIRRNM